MPGVRESPEGLTGVASQMMDAADQRMPTLSVNARRKFFHGLAVIMFVPGIAVDVSTYERRDADGSLHSPTSRSLSRSLPSTLLNT